jgi:hypothetical protein
MKTYSASNENIGLRSITLPPPLLRSTNFSPALFMFIVFSSHHATWHIVAKHTSFGANNHGLELAWLNK